MFKIFVADNKVILLHFIAVEFSKQAVRINLVKIQILKKVIK